MNKRRLNDVQSDKNNNEEPAVKSAKVLNSKYYFRALSVL